MTLTAFETTVRLQVEVSERDVWTSDLFVNHKAGRHVAAFVRRA